MWVSRRKDGSDGKAVRRVGLIGASLLQGIRPPAELTQKFGGRVERGVRGERLPVGAESNVSSFRAMSANQCPTVGPNRPVWVLAINQRNANKETPPANLGPVDAALKDIQDKEDWLQSRGAQALTKMEVNQERRPEVVKALQNIIDNSQPSGLRVEMVQALGTWANAQDVPYLVKLLDDKDANAHDRDDQSNNRPLPLPRHSANGNHVRDLQKKEDAREGHQHCNNVHNPLHVAHRSSWARVKLVNP